VVQADIEFLFSPFFSRHYLTTTMSFENQELMNGEPFMEKCCNRCMKLYIGLLGKHICLNSPAPRPIPSGFNNSLRSEQRASHLEASQPRAPSHSQGKGLSRLSPRLMSHGIKPNSDSDDQKRYEADLSEPAMNTTLSRHCSRVPDH
jgi:hypothetical protein